MSTSNISSLFEEELRKMHRETKRSRNFVEKEDGEYHIRFDTDMNTQLLLRNLLIMASNIEKQSIGAEYQVSDYQKFDIKILL